MLKNLLSSRYTTLDTPHKQGVYPSTKTKTMDSMKLLKTSAAVLALLALAACQKTPVAEAPAVAPEISIAAEPTAAAPADAPVVAVPATADAAAVPAPAEGAAAPVVAPAATNAVEVAK